MLVHIIDGSLVGYMTTKEVAKFLDVKPSTIRVWIKRGKVKPLTIKADGHTLNFIDRKWTLNKFREMYPEIATLADERKEKRNESIFITTNVRKD